ncbi:hypothetical protein CB1_000243057 [Camelus ferus]|nr:hypothetical protein CB1_000243057 [Camelus ferus]
MPHHRLYPPPPPHGHCGFQGDSRLLRRSKRRWVITTLELQEEDPGPFPKLVGELFNNVHDNTELMYFISGPGVDEHPETGLFSIEDHKNGKIYVHRPIDREKTPSFMICCDVAKRLTGKIVDKSLIVNIRVSDVNDHAPQFPEKEFNISVKENHDAGDEEGHFDILTDPETNEGILNVIKPLDYETHPAWSLVVAMENEEPLFSCEAGRLQKPRRAVASATVSVQVTNANDPPAFHPATFIVSVADGAGPGIQLGIFNAMDPDRTASQIRLGAPACQKGIQVRAGAGDAGGHVDGLGYLCLRGDVRSREN